VFKSSSFSGLSEGSLEIKGGECRLLSSYFINNQLYKHYSEFNKNMDSISISNVNGENTQFYDINSFNTVKHNKLCSDTTLVININSNDKSTSDYLSVLDSL
jgi:hypothetical protein